MTWAASSAASNGGCDYQVGAWVFGIGTDWSNVNKSGQSFDLPLFSNTYVKETQERWVAPCAADSA
jgi:hypothetical protein